MENVENTEVTKTQKETEGFLNDFSNLLKEKITNKMLDKNDLQKKLIEVVKNVVGISDSELSSSKEDNQLSFLQELEEAIDLSVGSASSEAETEIVKKISEIEDVLKLLQNNKHLTKQNIFKIEKIKEKTKEILKRAYDDYLVNIKEKQENSFKTINAEQAKRNSFVRVKCEKDEKDESSGETFPFYDSQVGKNSFIKEAYKKAKEVQENRLKAIHVEKNSFIKNDYNDDFVRGIKKAQFADSLKIAEERKNDLKASLKQLIKFRQRLLFDVKNKDVCLRLAETITVLELEFLKAKEHFKYLKRIIKSSQLPPPSGGA